MTDIRAGNDGLDDADRLPWLEAVEEDEGGGGPSAVKLIAFVVIGLAAIGLIVGGLFWMGNRAGGGSGAPEVIKAPEGDYKVRPDEPGGMKVEGEGDTAFAASEGADPRGRIDVAALPETPVAKGKAAAPPPKAPVQPAPKAAPPAAAPTDGGSTIQLGAFSTQAAANSAWKAMSGRFKYLAPLTHSVTPVESGGKTLYRLRASGAGADDICGRLKVAGESCVQID